MEKYPNFSHIIVWIPTPDFPHFDYMIGGNLGVIFVRRCFLDVEGSIWVLIASAPGHCLLVAFIQNKLDPVIIIIHRKKAKYINKVSLYLAAESENVCSSELIPSAIHRA